MKEYLPETSKQFTRLELSATWLPTAIGILTALVFLYQIIHFSSNAPSGYDDLVLIVTDSSDILKANSLADVWQFLFHQNAEHRPAMLRMLGMLSYAFYSTVSLPFINLISALVLLGSLLATLSSITQSAKQLLVMAGWAIPLVAAPTHYECMTWAACSGSHYTVIAFGLLAIFYASRSGWVNFVLFEICALLSLLSLFSGLSVLILGAAAIYLRDENIEIKRSALLTHSIIAALITAAYMNDLNLVHDYLPREKAIFLNDPISTLKHMAFWVLGWLGAWSQLNLLGAEINLTDHPVANPVPMLVTGTIVLCLLYRLLCHKASMVWKRYPQLCLATIFLAITIITAAIQRSMSTPLNGVLTPRYQIYSAFLIICLIALAIARHHQNANDQTTTLRIALPITLISMIFYASANYQLSSILERNYNTGKECIRVWAAKHKAPACWWVGETQRQIDDALATGIFRLE